MPRQWRIGGQIPYEILAIILKYEGGLCQDLRLDYIGGIYRHVYRSILGWIPQPETDTKKFLQVANYLYSSKIPKGHRFGPILKARKMRVHMLPWRKAFGNELYKILKYIEPEALHVAEHWNPNPPNIAELMSEIILTN